MRAMKQTVYLILLCIATAMLSCSTQKNTWASRSFHQMQTKYNIYYNGQKSFDEGLEAIDEAHEDDFSTLLPLYPVSDHKAASAASSHMDRTIEKCRKCIKLHSIKARPKKINYDKRRRDEKYKAWLEQEEFNNQMGNAWLLLAKAEFHKGDFLGSISTFNYIARHYAYDHDMVAQCQLWSARAYAEMGWQYEAEDVLSKVQEEHLARKHASLYAAVSADILLKAERHKEAIPFIKIALPDEKRHGYQPRFQYLLGQLYQMQGDKKQAKQAYQRVLKLQPDSEMDFNTRLRLAQLEDKVAASTNLLTKMAKQEKNKNRLDQIYGALGDIYLSRQDTAQALEYYTQAIEGSTKNGLNKAAVLLTAGDIYYQQRDYVHASPCYKEALQILSVEHNQYKRIQRRSETLDELVVEYSTVQLQDSLQHLSTLSEEEQLKIVEKIIEDLIASEKAAAEKEAQAAREAELDNGPRSVNTSNMLGGGGSGEWYFYNPQLMRSGQQTFRAQWGNRTLEDNWRRISKAATSTSIADAEETIQEVDSLGTEEQAAEPQETDNHKPAFYLQQIPKTEADFQRSNQLIADALYNMVYIYRDGVGDQALSDEAFEDFCRRFPDDERLLNLYYMQYLTALKDHRSADEARYKADILRLFPESQEAYIVSQPDYFDRLRRMAAEQDSLYEATYDAYRSTNFAGVKANKQHVEDNYPLTPLMPRFLFLNAIAVAKTEGQEAFVGELRDMVTRYPDNELAAMAKDMLALMGQGAESQTHSATSSLQERRMQEQNDLLAEEDTTISFSTERNALSLVVIVMPRDEKKLNHMLYKVALYNFTQFMIKDFELKQIPMLGVGECALQVSGFDSLDDALWYEGMLRKNLDIMQVLQENEAQLLCITEENFSLIGKHFTLEEYLEWAK